MYSTYNFITYKISSIQGGSFINPSAGEIPSWSTRFAALQSNLLTDYSLNDISSKGLKLKIKKQKYLHTIDENLCPSMKSSHTDDPMFCAIYAKARYQEEYSQDNLSHLNKYKHFSDPLQKSECKYNLNCKYWNKNQKHENPSILLTVKCHMTLFRHTPKEEQFPIAANIHNMILNNQWSQNKPLLKPDSDDKKQYEFTQVDGFMSAFVGEVIRNGFKYDLCLHCSANGCKHDDHTLLNVVNNKMNCHRHTTMDKPLRRDQMLALILYTRCDCFMDLCSSHINKNYVKWQWFDYCLYTAIEALSNHETGKYSVYVGIQKVKLNTKIIEEGYWTTYTSTSVSKDICRGLVQGEGMIMDIDAEFRKTAICCDVAWVFKFPMESEVILMARSVSRSGAFKCIVVDENRGIQFVKVSHSLAQKKEYIQIVEKSYRNLQKKLKHQSQSDDQKYDHEEKFRSFYPNYEKYAVLIRVHCPTQSDDNRYDTSFKVGIHYRKEYKIKYLINAALLKLQKMFDPIKFELISIDKLFDNENCKQMNLKNLLDLSITNANYDKLLVTEVCITVSIATYHHKVGNLDKISCPTMLEENTNDATHCVIYAKMKYHHEYSTENLNHMENFTHFQSDYDGKPKCRYLDNCLAYKRLQKGSVRVNDKCHMILYLHPPRRRNITTKDGIHAFEVNKAKYQNQPLYKPSFDDELKYEYNEHDGYLNALMDEIIVNKLEGELGDKYNEQYQLLIAVDCKLNCKRHKQMGSPLNRGEMLAIICYTGTECYSAMTKCQRNGDFITWKWFDYCLYSAIKKLGIREWGSYALYSGHNGVKLNKKIIRNTFFKTYISSSWMKFVAVSFCSGEENTAEEKKNNGMIMQIDPEFRESFGSICCDVSWISKFRDEFEVLIARGIDNTNNNFDMKVIEDKDGIQTVLLTKCNQ